MNYLFTIIIITLAFVYYINAINISETLKDTIHIHLFNGLSLLFILIFIYYYIFFGLKRGLFTTFIIWCLFVGATPLPEAGLLVSVPLKNLLNIDLDITQMVVSFIALGFIFYSYYNFREDLTTTKSGRFLLRIIDFGSFSIFVTSIIASVSMAYLLNELIDHMMYKKEINTNKNRMYVVFFVVPFIMYFVVLRQLTYKFEY
jgi:hypothetical protein